MTFDSWRTPGEWYICNTCGERKNERNYLRYHRKGGVKLMLKCKACQRITRSQNETDRG